MNGQLSRRERSGLDRRAQLDVRRDVVRRYALASPKGVAPQAYTTDVANSVLLSPFINSELSSYMAMRDHYIGKKRILVWLFDESHHKFYHRRILSEALAEIDNQINRYKMDISLLADSYGEQLKELERRQKQHERRHEEHMTQLCYDKARHLRASYAAETNDLYRGIIDLLGQKAIHLDRLDGKMLARRAHIYRRIRFYLSRVLTYSPDLGSDIISDETLAKVANTSTMDKYEAVREDVRQQLAHYQSEFDAV